MITVGLDGHDAALSRLAAMPQAMRAALAAEAERLGARLRQTAERNLSGSVLQRRSGRLAASLAVAVAAGDDTVTTSLAAATPYARIHEYGGTIPGRAVLPASGRVLAFPWRGRARFFKHVSLPAVNLPERSYLRSALAALEPEIREGVAAAVQQAVRS